MASEQILIYLPDPEFGLLLERMTLRPAGYEVIQVKDLAMIESLARAGTPDVIILGDKLPSGGPGVLKDGLELAAGLLEVNPHLSIILLASEHTDRLVINALRIGIVDYLSLPVALKEVLQAVQRTVKRRQQADAWTHLEIKLNTKILQQRVDSLESLQRVGRAVTASLDLDSVLTAVVDAAVELTGSEEGSLLLLDEASGELYMRAARNFREDFVRTFRMPIHDTLAGEVLRTGKPILLDEQTPRKIKTAYLVRSLMYVPLMVQDHAIGVLGIDNQQGGHTFSEYHMSLVSALASYAAIAIENARRFAHSEVERQKFETILTGIKDSVIVVDQDNRLVLVNQAAREAFNIAEENPTNKLVSEVIQHPDLLEVLIAQSPGGPYRTELALEDGRVLNAQVTPISGVGLAVIMQDITYLKELDRIKSDFVSTVSHDLRSPLTAILGYVELIERVGPVNAQQREFIKRVEVSVQNITALINDLLDLGRIEAGFDTRKEIVSLGAVINYTLEGMRNRILDKSQVLEVEIQDKEPPVLGNPVRLRQMVANLVGNAVKYTQEGGKVRVQVRAEGGQIIMQVIDNGPGVPTADQPYIFDKFYRASNVPMDIPGTGLGLAIVRSIVENHQGRIWVNSAPGQGATFTVVLPVADQEL